MLADKVHALVRKRSIADGISEAIDCLGLQFLDPFQNLLQGLEVTVDIGDNSNEHAAAPDG
jgi:hypothetical protein